MKIGAARASGILIFVALLFAGCHETHESTTKINSDGSILRTEKISTDDSSSISTASLPPWVDSTWSIRIERSGKGIYSKLASKRFQDVAAMNQALEGEAGTSLRFRADLERRFRWFFTEFRYREICRKWNPFDQVPITEYVSPSEIDLWFRYEIRKQPYATRGDSLALRGAEDRAGEWQFRSMFESYFAAFMKGVELLHDSSLTPSAVLRHKEELFSKARLQLEHSPNRIDSLHALFARELGSRSARRAIELNAAGFALYTRKIDFMEKMILVDGVKATIEMPGLIIDTNAPTIEGNTVTWDDIRWYAYLQDFEMRVDSRMVNWWAVIITGVLLLGIVLLTALGIVRRRRFA